MAKEAAITIRVPATMKRALEARAARQRRSLSAQVVFDLQRVLASEPSQASEGSFLGRYGGGRVPTEEDFAEVRELMWGRLGEDDPDA